MCVVCGMFRANEDNCGMNRVCVFCLIVSLRGELLLLTAAAVAVIDNDRY